MIQIIIDQRRCLFHQLPFTEKKSLLLSGKILSDQVHTSLLSINQRSSNWMSLIRLLITVVVITIIYSTSANSLSVVNKMINIHLDGADSNIKVDRWSAVSRFTACFVIFVTLSRYCSRSPQLHCPSRQVMTTTIFPQSNEFNATQDLTRLSICRYNRDTQINSQKMNPPLLRRLWLFNCYYDSGDREWQNEE